MTIIETSNGHVKGRQAPPEKLEPFTFEGTGRTVLVRKLPTFWREQLRKQVERSPGFEKPEPPIVTVDYGDGKIQRPHTGHPVYQELLQEWQQKINREVGELIKPFVARRGVVFDSGDEEVKALIQERRQWTEEDGLDTSEFDDHYFYVAFCCVALYEDWIALLKAVFEKSSPQEAAIESYKAAFQGDLRREGSVELQSGPAAGPDGA